MWLLSALLLLSASSDSFPVFGVASTADRSGCASFKSPVKAGAKVSLVFPHPPQRVETATLGPILGEPCRALANALLSGPFHRLLGERELSEPSELAIAVAG